MWRAIYDLCLNVILLLVLLSIGLSIVKHPEPWVKGTVRVVSATADVFTRVVTRLANGGEAADETSGATPTAGERSERSTVGKADRPTGRDDGDSTHAEPGDNRPRDREPRRPVSSTLVLGLLLLTATSVVLHGRARAAAPQEGELAGPRPHASPAKTGFDIPDAEQPISINFAVADASGSGAGKEL